MKLRSLRLVSETGSGSEVVVEMVSVEGWVCFVSVEGVGSMVGGSISGCFSGLVSSVIGMGSGGMDFICSWAAVSVVMDMAAASGSFSLESFGGSDTCEGDSVVSLTGSSVADFLCFLRPVLEV